MKSLKESFEWSKGLDGYPKDQLLKAVAKTLRPTVHAEDPNYPVRIFAEGELVKNARSLIGRPVGLNHGQMPIYGAYAVDAEWNEAEKQLETILLVPPDYVRKVAEGKIKNVSIEYTWRDAKKTDLGTEFLGLGITRVDLVEGLEPGDPNAIVSLFEAAEKRGIVLAEVAPLAVAAPTAQPQQAPAPAPEPAKAPEAPKPAEDVAALKTAITNLSAQLIEKDKTIQARVDEEVKKAKAAMATKVNAALVKNPIITRGHGGRVARMVKDVKKALGECYEPGE